MGTLPGSLLAARMADLIHILTANNARRKHPHSKLRGWTGGAEIRGAGDGVKGAGKGDGGRGGGGREFFGAGVIPKFVVFY